MGTCTALVTSRADGLTVVDGVAGIAYSAEGVTLKDAFGVVLRTFQRTDVIAMTLV